MSIWTILLTEVVIPAVKEAIAKEFGKGGERVANIIDDPKRAVANVVNDPKAKAEIERSLTNIFAAILRVFK